MADGVAITAGTGTTINTDDLGAAGHVQRVKATWGPDGTCNDTDVATGKPLPVQLRSSTGTDLIGTAGTASAAVVSVQGIASGTAMNIISGQNGVGAGAGVVGATVQRVTIASDDYLLTSLAPVSAAFTPAASSHTAGDSVGGAATFSSIGPSGKQVLITRAKFTVSSATVPASSFTLWLFNTAPTVVADDAAFGVLVADLSKFIGKISLGSPALAGVSGTATISSIEQNGLSIPVLLSGTDIVAYLTNDTTVTTVAQAHTVQLFTSPLS